MWRGHWTAPHQSRTWTRAASLRQICINNHGRFHRVTGHAGCTGQLYGLERRFRTFPALLGPAGLRALPQDGRVLLVPLRMLTPFYIKSHAPKVRK